MKEAEALFSALVGNPAELGSLVRARRKAARLTQAQAAGLAGVGNRFLSELERGKKSLELGLVIQVLHRLGLELAVAPRGTLPFRRGAAPATSGAGLVQADPRGAPAPKALSASPRAKLAEPVRAQDTPKRARGAAAPVARTRKKGGRRGR